ncbi:MAG TPA: TonB-dependent receptor, partial [Albitalea sp.]|nr:TonB-dependent receptor [Albitalea sp.]
GIRHGIESSVATKRNSDSIVEAVSAEDIGKLPDVSIAESLARLPGLAGQRVAGRSQVIAIRGLSPDFAGTLLNGRQQVTTGDNRSVEFDQFPSELLNSATVYKTPDASIIGQGLSGTIDLHTIRPLDVRGRKVVFNARAESNSNGKLNANTSATGNRFSASYIDQFADNTVGVALGFAHLDSPLQELHYKAWGYGKLNADCTAHPEWGCSQATGVPAGATVLNGFEAEAISSSQKRDGLMAVLEYKPSKDLHSTVDLYYSKFKKNETMRGLMGGLAEGWSGRPGVAYSNVGTTNVGGATLVTSADLANATMTVRNDDNTREDELKSVGWNLKGRLADKWTGTADVGYSRADRQENVIETYAGILPRGSGTFKESIPVGPGFPSLVPGQDYANPATVLLTDAQGDWGHDGLWKKPKAVDELKSLRLVATRDLDGAFSNVDFGLDYTSREKDRQMNELAANLKNGRTPVAVAPGLVQPATSLGFAGIPGVLAYDVMGALASQYDLVPQALDQVTKRNYEVFEKVTTAFVKLGLDTSFNGIPVHGNAGVQLVHTDQSSHGISRLQGVDADTTRGTTYNDVLPSANLNFELGGDKYLRMGVAKTLARARMDDMRAGADVSISSTGTPKWSGSGGNPDLKPWRATSFDLSLEKYFGKRSYIAGAAFYKDLSTYIYQQTSDYDFTGIPNTSSLPTPPSPIGTFTRPANGQGGNIKGVELSASLEGGLVNRMLDGFGVVASASYTDSNIQPEGPGSSQPLPGLSRVVGGLTLYYERGGFSTRISERYRSKFRGEVSGLHQAREFPVILADRQTDVQFSYDFNEGRLKGLSVLLQVNNLTNSGYATQQTNDFPGGVVAPQEYNKYGRQTLLGVNYKL